MQFENTKTASDADQADEYRLRLGDEQREFRSHARQRYSRLINHKGQKMNSNHEPQSPKNTGERSISALNWTYALDDSALPEGSMAPAYPQGVNVVLARVGGAVYAVAGTCAHMACPLFMGRLEGYTIVCGCHDWRFDVRTGRFLSAPELGVAVYPTRLDAGKLFVKLG